MKNHFIRLLIAISVLMIMFSSCDSFQKYEKGVVEEKSLTYTGNYSYSCIDSYVDPNDHPSGETWSEGNSTKVYWSDESCASLGYKERGGDYFYNRDGSEFPGENGYWADGGDNPNTPAFCTGYIAPTSDVQLNSYCENAYNALCILLVDEEDERVTSSCANYNGFLQMDPSLPECEYCK